MEINVYDMLVFNDEVGNIYQDCVYSIINNYAICNKYIYNCQNNEISDKEVLEEINFKTLNKNMFTEDNFNKHNKHLNWKLKEVWTKIDKDIYKRVWSK